MKKIAIYGQYIQKDSIATLDSVLQELKARDCHVDIVSSYKQLVSDQLAVDDYGSYDQLDSTYDLLISIGGDGTILRAVSYIGMLNIPVMGINTGRLGFLATLQPDKLSQAFSDLFASRYNLSKRTLITAGVLGKDDTHTNFALNEVTVSRMNTTSMIQIETHLNDEYLTSYWADGLIISTPTGSTGYSLSCGGPVINPGADALVITPIAPHNLNARPLVIPDDTVIRLKIKGRESTFLTSLDNRVIAYPDQTEIIIQKATFTIDVIQLHGTSFIKTIRNKLLWGEDNRN